MTGRLLEGGLCCLVANEQRIETVGQSRDGSACLILGAREIRKAWVAVAAGYGGLLQITVAIWNASNRKKTTVCVFRPILLYVAGKSSLQMVRKPRFGIRPRSGHADS